MIAQILFIITLGVAGFFIAKRVGFLRKAILLGKSMPLKSPKQDRLKNMILFAFGQKKMFTRPIPAILHFMIYAGFVIINIEILEIIIDGVTGSHRIFTQFLPDNIYAAFISSFEILAALVLLACVAFIARRNLMKLPRFAKPEMKGWPKNDANIILVVEIVLMLAFLFMNGADIQLQSIGANHYPLIEGGFLISNKLATVFNGMGEASLIGIERTLWWLHIVGILAFAIYVTYSKHLHIALAFPNTYYAEVNHSGEMRNMPELTKEVKYALGLEEPSGDEVPPETFGAKDVTDLSRKQLMDAFACTECGRCTSACPANITGKKLSPRAIMMKTRDRAEELTQFQLKEKKEHDGKSLLHDFISQEELNACTTCQACVQECPVNINPLSIISELRRHLILDEAKAPGEWNNMFTNMENNFAPWQMNPDSRADWTTTDN